MTVQQTPSAIHHNIARLIKRVLMNVDEMAIGVTVGLKVKGIVECPWERTFKGLCFSQGAALGQSPQSCTMTAFFWRSLAILRVPKAY